MKEATGTVASFFPSILVIRPRSFAFLLSQKLLFRSVKPSRATLVRVAFDLSNLRRQKSHTPDGVWLFW